MTPYVPALSGIFALLALAGRAGAVPTAIGDRGVQLGGSSTLPEPARLPWHDTFLIWDHSVTTHTLGVGADYQSRNPSYEMTLRLAPRYYFIDQRERSLSLRADLRLLREFTNSDTTSERGEWTFTDSELSLTGVETVRSTPGSRSQVVLRAPTLTFPTSKTSALGGRFLGLGVGVGLDQELSLLGNDAPALLGVLLRPRVNYSYQFARAVVATSDRLDRIRLDSDGRSAASDQLSGATLPQHQLNLSLRADTLLSKQLTLETEFGMRYAYRYALPERVDCQAIARGCVEVASRADATRWGVSTLFAASLGYEIATVFELSVGYVNLSPQLGADGRRRNVFYSPDARAFVALTVALDGAYQAARGRTATEPSRGAGAPAATSF